MACGPAFTWLGDRDSNPGRLIQSQLSYRWTIPQRQGDYTTQNAEMQAPGARPAQATAAFDVQMALVHNGMLRAPSSRPLRLQGVALSMTLHIVQMQARWARDYAWRAFSMRAYGSRRATVRLKTGAPGRESGSAQK